MADKAPGKDAKAKLYNLNGKLQGDVEIKQAKTKEGDKPYALAKLEGKDGKVTTLMTFVKAGMDFLKDKKAGDSIKCYGTYTQSDKGRTFSVMGEAKAKEKAAPEGPEM